MIAESTSLHRLPEAPDFASDKVCVALPMQLQLSNTKDGGDVRHERSYFDIDEVLEGAAVGLDKLDKVVDGHEPLRPVDIPPNHVSLYPQNHFGCNVFPALLH